MYQEEMNQFNFDRNRGRRIRLTLKARITEEETFVLEGIVSGLYLGALVIEGPYIEDLSSITDPQLRRFTERKYSGEEAQIQSGFIKDHEFLREESD